MESRVGDVLAGKYRLDEELGRGGMGAVYRAFHLGVHRTFAVKILNVDLAQKRGVADRFFREAQAAGRIGHPSILEVFDVGEDEGGRPFMVMELLDGEPLSDLVARGPLEPDVACWIASELLSALAAAHDAEVIHRDVKPQNVFLVGRTAGPRTLKLLDFGIAKFLEGEGASVTRSGEIIGSPLYMAPEQALGETGVDARADVWSAGAVLFQMLTGQAAHDGSSAAAVLAKVLTMPVTAPSSRREGIAPELDAIVLRALAIPREDRWPSARAMREAIDAFRDDRERAPSFPALPPRAVVVKRDQDASGDGATAAARASTGAIGASTAGAPLVATLSQIDSAATGEGPARSRRRMFVAVVAGVLLVGAAVAPWLVPEWRGSSPTPATPGAASPPSPPPPPAATSLEARPRGDTPVEVRHEAGASEAPAASEARDDATSKSAPLPARRTDAGARDVSPAECGEGAVRSHGHCCPRGMVWQSGAGRCERPLATSF